VAIDRGVQELVIDEHIDALIGTHEGSAALAIPALQRLDLTVGPEFPVVSGVSSASDEHTRPPLTAVDMRPFEFGRAAAQRLIELIQQPPVTDQFWAHEASLIVRESTERPARSQEITG
jgi:DNA-binding LacI/PurR family transcriptional regulator